MGRFFSKEPKCVKCNELFEIGDEYYPFFNKYIHESCLIDMLTGKVPSVLEILNTMEKYKLVKGTKEGKDYTPQEIEQGKQWLKELTKKDKSSVVIAESE